MGRLCVIAEFGLPEQETPGSTGRLTVKKDSTLHGMNSDNSGKILII